jgi:RNA polymerase sigma factor (sigma-70 family)
MPPPPTEVFASRLFLGPALRAQPDRRLVTLVREGYEAAFEEIVRRYGRPLTRYAAAIVGSRSEDVTQDAFSKALQALRRDESAIELRPWLYRIVRNTALNDLRDRPAATAELAEAIVGGRAPAEVVEEREELSDLIHRLRALPEPQRAAIVMRELEGLGHDEIAAALGLSGGAARQAIYRARQALRDGVGILVPVPLLKALLDGFGPRAAESAAGASGVGGAAGAGVALKATAATVLVAGAVGAGVTIKGPRHEETPVPRPAAPAIAARTPGADGGTGTGQTPKFASRSLGGTASGALGSGAGQRESSRSLPGRSDGDGPASPGPSAHRPAPSGRGPGGRGGTGLQPAGGGGNEGLHPAAGSIENEGEGHHDSGPDHEQQLESSAGDGGESSGHGGESSGDGGTGGETGGDEHSGGEGTESNDAEDSPTTDGEHVDGSGDGDSSSEVVDPSTDAVESPQSP